MMARYIDANALIEEIHSYTMYDEISKYDIERAIDEAPTVDAEPVRHGRWKTVPYRIVEHGNVVISGEAEMCTNCRCAKKEYHKQMNYCPNCGAKMDEGVR